MNNIANFTVWDGILVSIFMMLVVFLILFILSVLLGSLKYLIKPDVTPKTKDTSNLQRAKLASTDDEDAMVAMLVAACVAKQELKQDVRIISCKYIK